MTNIEELHETGATQYNANIKYNALKTQPHALNTEQRRELTREQLNQYYEDHLNTLLPFNDAGDANKRVLGVIHSLYREAYDRQLDKRKLAQEGVYTTSSGVHYMTADERNQRAQTITDAYLEAHDYDVDMSDGFGHYAIALERLADYLLFDELSDKSPYKATDAEYPISSRHQDERHTDRQVELSDVGALFNANDNVMGRTRSTQIVGDEERIVAGSAVVEARDLSDSDEFITEALRQVVESTRDLTKMELRVVWERHVNDVTYAELSEMTGISASSLRHAHTRAVRKLRESERVKALYGDGVSW